MAGSGARLKDVAHATGFSVNTVSLALRDSPRIPDETRTRIKAAADELNYLPNHVARSLVSRETKSIGLILTDVRNPVLTSVAQSIESRLARSGYTTLFATSNNTMEEELTMIEAFRARQTDGMLIFPFSHKRFDHIRALRERGYPVVLLVGDQDAGVDAVSMDERVGARKAVRHLLDRGHRRIAFLDAAAAVGNAEKRDGYSQAHGEADVPVDADLIISPTGNSVHAGYLAMSRVAAMHPRPTAVFASNDSLALGVLRYCVKNGLRVPDDLAIVGFDNIEFAEFAVTALSTVRYDVEKVSDLAVRRILELIGHKGALPEPRIVQVEPELIVRDSS